VGVLADCGADTIVKWFWELAKSGLSAAHTGTRWLLNLAPSILLGAIAVSLGAIFPIHLHLAAKPEATLPDALRRVTNPGRTLGSARIFFSS
jgi:hypothetical protein